VKKWPEDERKMVTVNDPIIVAIALGKMLGNNDRKLPTNWT
jgi:hypothetical protein